MLLKVISHTLVFIHILNNCVAEERVNDYQWRAVLSFLNVTSVQETRASLIVTAKNSLCAEHMKIYLDQISTSTWAVQSEY
jgi:hypothetical protein